MKRHKLINPFFFLVVLMCLAGAALVSPPAFAGWEPGNAAPLRTEVASEPYQNQEAREAFKAEVVRLINIERADNGLQELEELQALTGLADIRAEESAAFFSHTRPNKENCCTIYSDYGLAYSAVGENLSYGFSSPARLVEAWMNSETHCANILNAKFFYVGTGLYVNKDGTLYCSQLFYLP